MRRRRLALPLASALLALASPAYAVAVPAVPADKPQLLSAWTQPSAASYNTWWAARQNQAAWSSYAFDWSTDYCSGAPDNPLGFPFQYSCARHDFGYRNYKAAGQFEANKARLDTAFHEDMKRVCARYAGDAVRVSCHTMAWTYYQGVSAFGTPAKDAVSGVRRAV
ncbi:phospholipase [Streptomyces sp. NPDC003036]|uniref:phospholipase n=1 Tax=Streptomyces sp. NPDC003036 TaxID=3154442 RepID=UPI0033A1AD8A